MEYRRTGISSAGHTLGGEGWKISAGGALKEMPIEGEEARRKGKGINRRRKIGGQAKR